MTIDWKDIERKDMPHRAALKRQRIVARHIREGVIPNIEVSNRNVLARLHNAIDDATMEIHENDRAIREMMAMMKVIRTLMRIGE